MKTIKYYLQLLIATSLSLQIPVYANVEGQDRGGGNLTKINESVIQYLLENGAIKSSIVNYIDTLIVEQIETTTDEGKMVQTIFAKLKPQDVLKNDIINSRYVLSDNCAEELKTQDGLKVGLIPASTQIGQPGADICFDIKVIKENMGNISQEELMIRLASLALHEHIHHFQDPQLQIEQNEVEAYLVSAYVQLTAKVVQVPLLKWEPPVIAKYEGCDGEYGKFSDKLSNKAHKLSDKDRLFSRSGVGFILLGLTLASTGGAAIPFIFGTWIVGGGILTYQVFKYPLPQLNNVYDQLYNSRLIEEVLKGARKGEGPVFNIIMPQVWKLTNRYGISPKDFARSVSELNEQKEFCKDPNNLDSFELLLHKSMQNLEVELPKNFTIKP